MCDCKHKLTTALLDELFERYSSIKDAISTDYDQLARILNENQIIEIKDFLKKREQGMAPMLAQRNKRQYEAPKRQEKKSVAPKRRKTAAKPQKKRNENNQIKQFVLQLKKLLK